MLALLGRLMRCLPEEAPQLSTKDEDGTPAEGTPISSWSSTRRMVVQDDEQAANLYRPESVSNVDKAWWAASALAAAKSEIAREAGEATAAGGGAAATPSPFVSHADKTRPEGTRPFVSHADSFGGASVKSDADSIRERREQIALDRLHRELSTGELALPAGAEAAVSEVFDAAGMAVPSPPGTQSPSAPPHEASSPQAHRKAAAGTTLVQSPKAQKAAAEKAAAEKAEQLAALEAQRVEKLAALEKLAAERKAAERAKKVLEAT